jgi:hypothetical protein
MPTKSRSARFLRRDIAGEPLEIRWTGEFGKATDTSFGTQDVADYRTIPSQGEEVITGLTDARMLRHCKRLINEPPCSKLEPSPRPKPTR